MIDLHSTDSFSELGTTASTFNSVALSTRVRPAYGAAVGGDWCETFVVSDDVVALSIGDVCGHGIEAFETMTGVRKAIRDAAGQGLDPARTLAEANRFLRDYDPSIYATATFALLHPERGTLVFANAGHPAPLLVNAYNSSLLEFPESELPLGVSAAFLPALRVVAIPAETLLVLYTDGVIERERNSLRGTAQLRRAARSAYRNAIGATASDIERRLFLSGSNHDDASILTARTPYRANRNTPAPRRRYDFRGHHRR